MEPPPIAHPPMNRVGYVGNHGAHRPPQQQHFVSHSQEGGASSDQQHIYNEQYQRQPQHYLPPPQHQQHQQQQQPVAVQEEMSLEQRIAQKMLTSHVDGGSSGRNSRGQEIYNVVGIHTIPEPQPPAPPWENDTGRALLPRQGDLPVLQLHQALLPPLNVNFATMNNDPTKFITNNTITTTSSATLPPIANPPSKSVTFGTHDQFHQWDEQLDILKYVDEEFFHVAHFLMDIVGPDIMNLEEYEIMEQLMNNQQQQSCRSGSGGVLSRLFFGCTGGGDGGVENFGTAEQNNNRGANAKGQSEKYQLTKKLVNDFYSAIQFRMKNIELNSSRDDDEEEGEENDVITRTREVARKINAYGLPLLPPSAKVEISGDEKNDDPSSLDRDAVCDKEEDDDEDDVELLDTFGRGIKRQFFPVLPINDDDESGADDENDQSLSNQVLRRGKSRDPKASSTPKSAATTFSMPTPTSIFTSLLKPKSSTPSEEECQKRLVQIRLEIEKVQRMIDNTQNESVQSACQKRIYKLKDERRFYQIIHERHKLQSMMETTEVGIVREACKARFKQLILELETIQIQEEEDDDDENNNRAPADDEGPVCEPILCADGTSAGNVSNNKSLTGDQEDSQWYERALQYVNGSAAPLHEEEVSVSRRSATGHHALERREYPPTLHDEEVSLARRNATGHHAPERREEYLPPEQCQEQQVRFSESRHSPQRPLERFCVRYIEDSNNRSVLSPPRSDMTQHDAQNNPEYPVGAGQGRQPVARHPVANAAKSRTPWFG